MRSDSNTTPVSGPGFLVISPSLDCNNACIFCYDNYRVKGSRPAASAQEIAADAARMAARMGVGAVAVSGGEPLLYAELEQLTRLLKAAGLFVCVMTNGRLLARAQRLERLLEAGVDHFHIPLHSDDQAAHDAVTGVAGSFAQTVAGLANVAEVRARRPLGLTVVHVMHRRNYRRLPELVDFVAGFAPDHALLSHCIVEVQSPREHLALLARFEDIAPFVAQAHRVGQARGLPVYVENVPPCMMRGREAICVDFHKFNRLAVGGFKAAGERGEGGFEPFEQSIKSGQRTHADQCRRCAIQDFCGGFYRSYIEAMGQPDLEPYSVQELRSRQAAARQTP